MSFGALKALNYISFDLREGEILGLIGPNGSGKTTLFNVIAGVYRPSSGRVFFRGVEITGLPPHRVCRLGIVKTSQIVRPFKEMTVRENVLVAAMYGQGLSLRRARVKADEILELVGLIHLSDSPSRTLSIPERRRLELARALATATLCPSPPLSWCGMWWSLLPRPSLASSSAPPPGLSHPPFLPSPGAGPRCPGRRGRGSGCGTGRRSPRSSA